MDWRILTKLTKLKVVWTRYDTDLYDLYGHLHPNSAHTRHLHTEVHFRWKVTAITSTNVSHQTQIRRSTDFNSKWDFRRSMKMRFHRSTDLDSNWNLMRIQNSTEFWILSLRIKTQSKSKFIKSLKSNSNWNL